MRAPIGALPLRDPYEDTGDSAANGMRMDFLAQLAKPGHYTQSQFPNQANSTSLRPILAAFSMSSKPTLRYRGLAGHLLEDTRRQ